MGVRVPPPAYLDPNEVLVAADVAMADRLSGSDVAVALARVRTAVAREARDRAALPHAR
jgi:hypothetical protein